MQNQHNQTSEEQLSLTNIQSINFEEDIALLSNTQSSTAIFSTVEFQTPRLLRGRRRPNTARRTRVMKSNSRWTPTDKVRYWKAVIILNKLNKNAKLSWSFWKSEKTFNYIADMMQTKTSDQVKSYDLRMKKQFYLKKGIDLIPAAIMQLVDVKDSDPQAQQILDSHYEHEGSSSEHMDIIKQKMQQITQMDKLILNLSNLMKMHQSGSQHDEIFMDQE